MFGGYFHFIFPYQYFSDNCEADFEVWLPPPQFKYDATCLNGLVCYPSIPDKMFLFDACEAFQEVFRKYDFKDT